jgi:hypothetical protein
MVKGEGMKEMTGFIAVGHMLLEEGKIVAVRHEQRGVRIDYDQILKGAMETLKKEDLEAEGFEIGWRCPKCQGDGEIAVRCSCVNRSNYAQMNNPCCSGWDSADCPECEGGIKWEEEY